MISRLCVSFWDLCLDNLPQGRFEHRGIGAGDASQMIRAAHVDKTLLCVSKDDLLAPYRTKERRRHEELCAVLRASYDCPLRFEDFLTTFDDEETAVESIAPLQVAELKPGDRLLIVTCNYQLADKTKRGGDLEDRGAARPGRIISHSPQPRNPYGRAMLEGNAAVVLDLVRSLADPVIIAESLNMT